MTKYIPKVNDAVFLAGKGPIRHVVVAVDSQKKTVSVQMMTAGPITLTKPNIPWSRLEPLDESQNALQIVREATEDK